MAIPTKDECELYYKMWRMGKNNTEISQALSFSEGRMSEHLPYFVHHARIRMKEDCREGLAIGRPPSFELSPERRSQFLKMAAAGLPYTQIAKIMNIPLPTIMDIWFVEDPVFKDQVDTVMDLMNARVVQALYKKAIGHRTVVRTVSRTSGTGEKGLPINTKTVTKQDKIVDGDFNAQKFWTINRLPKDWSVDGFVNKEGNKGSIMKLLDGVVAEGGVDDDARFDKEQLEKEKQERITP